MTSTNFAEKYEIWNVSRPLYPTKYEDFTFECLLGGTRMPYEHRARHTLFDPIPQPSRASRSRRWTPAVVDMETEEARMRRRHAISIVRRRRRR